MDYTDYLVIKLVVLCVLAFIVNFVYTLSTGRYLESDLRDIKAAEQPAQTKDAQER